MAEALAMLCAPRGGGPGADAARDAALGTLLAAPDTAYPRLLALAAGHHPPPLILLALAAFGRDESIEILAHALHGGDAPTAALAAEALARHAQPGARRALEAALLGTPDQVAAIAAGAIAARGDSASLPALRAARLARPQGEAQDRIAAAITVLC